MVYKRTPLRRMATSMELPPPSPSQAPSFSQPTLEVDDFVRWGKDLRSGSSGSGGFGSSSSYSSIHVSRTSSSESSLFPEDLSSEPEESHSTLKPYRPSSSRRLRARLSDPASQSGRPPDTPPLDSGKPGDPNPPKLVEMLKGVSETLEENTRLKKKRLEKEARRSRLKTRTPARPYDVVPVERVPSTSGKATRRVPGGSAKKTVKVLDPEPVSGDPPPGKSRQNTVSKGKSKEVAKEAAKIPIDDHMEVDSSVTLGDVPMNEEPWLTSMDGRSKSPVSDSQSSAKMMPPPPVPSKALKQLIKQESPTPSKTPHCPPLPLPSPTQSNPSRRRTLGMTRTATQTSVSHSVIPAKRKPFKSPLIKQEPDLPQPGGPPRSQSRAYPIPTPSTCSQPIYSTQKPAPKPSKPKKADSPEVMTIGDDPDTSYDFSASSIDGDELNRVMEEYDRSAS